MTSVEFTRILARAMSESSKIEMAVPRLLLQLLRPGGLWGCTLPPPGEPK
jgi:hypothetical protein